MEWGPLTRQDAGPLTELCAAMRAGDRTGRIYSVDDMAEELDHPRIDLAEGTIAAREGDRIVAFGHLPVRQSAEGEHVMLLWGGVHPGHRGQGLGRRVLDWSIGAAPGLSARAFPGVPLELQLSVDDTNPGFKALAERAGFAVVRSFAHMERRLSGDLPVAAPPAGVTIATWSPDLDEGARNVRNVAFRDHWGSVPHTAESWQSVIVGTRHFRPESSFVAVAGGQAVGALITHFFEAQSARLGERQAWIQIVGTLREWRGKGVAGALLAHALAAFTAQGYASTGLGVDADNPTGAVSVYARAGFEITKRSSAYALPLKTT
ncbi:GNAT family N-acetyltransferase [Nonomuraea sp. NPDC002799]